MTPYYQRDGIMMYHADCLDVLSEDGSASVDHVITDPPFTQRTSENMRSRRDIKDGGEFIAANGGRRRIDFDGIDGMEGEIANTCLRVAGRWVIIFCALEQLGKYADAAGCEYVRSSVWERTNSAPQFTGDRPGQAHEGVAIMHRKGRKRWNRGGHSLTWKGPTINGFDPDRGIAHPTPKPVWLIKDIVEAFSDEREIVLDPFMGSGTTAIACIRTGRQFIGIEIEEKYCEIAVKRIERELAQPMLPIMEPQSMDVQANMFTEDDA